MHFEIKMHSKPIQDVYKVRPTMSKALNPLQGRIQ